MVIFKKQFLTTSPLGCMLAPPVMLQLFISVMLWLVMRSVLRNSPVNLAHSVYGDGEECAYILSVLPSSQISWKEVLSSCKLG